MKWLIATLVAFCLISWADGARAQSLAGSTMDPETVLIASNPDSLVPSTSKGPYYYQSENELRARKLMRGAANMLLCVAEVPNQMFQEAYRTSPVTGVVVGAFKGAWKGVQRLGIGAWEVLTFYHPTKNHYQPYIQPEVVFQEYLH